ncbi:hypothetical protein PybrP1_011552 [[Pythium] brassicae (nom. inval.)]|nr:hypothetical protein PybrP1_011552 [[Pythium] brassicae (nom. inval.)]
MDFASDMSGVSGDAAEPLAPPRVLSQAQIDEFMREGVLVVPNVLSPAEVAAARAGLHGELAKYGVNHDDLEHTGQHLKQLSSTGGAGGILDLFYPSWRLRVAEHAGVFAAMTDLWSATYATSHPDFAHPHGPFDGKRGYMYINRVCYRVPDVVSRRHGAAKARPLQRSLTPHLDCCPAHPFASGKAVPRWRPIQCLTVLTDNLAPDTGGFEAVRGFHKEFASYFADAATARAGAGAAAGVGAGRPQVCLGDFSPLRMAEDRDVIARFAHVGAAAGSAIFFDWRVPHANSYRHAGAAPREVVYTGFLPDVALNRAYVREQLRRYARRLLPADHWQKGDADARVAEHFSAHHFSALGSRLIGLYPW